MLFRGFQTDWRGLTLFFWCLSCAFASRKASRPLIAPRTSSSSVINPSVSVLWLTCAAAKVNPPPRWKMKGLMGLWMGVGRANETELPMFSGGICVLRSGDGCLGMDFRQEGIGVAKQSCSTSRGKGRCSVFWGRFRWSGNAVDSLLLLVDVPDLLDLSLTLFSEFGCALARSVWPKL